MNICAVEIIFFLSILLKGPGCQNLQISLPEKIDALSGSCVLIKCTIEINSTEHYESLINGSAAFWSINNTKSIFSLNSVQMRENRIGNLKERNCTTIFYDISSNRSGTYYFNIGTETAQSNISHKVTINVIESPPQPAVSWYTEQKDVLYRGDVLEGTSVSLRCSAKTLCSSLPPLLRWSSYPNLPLSGSTRLQEQELQTELISDLNFTATYLQHRTTFICTITYQLQDKNKTAQNTFILNVQYAPKISLSSSCYRTNVTVCFCEVLGNPLPKISWYLAEHPVTNSTCTSISEERYSLTRVRSSFTLPHYLTAQTTLLCVGTNIHGNASQQFQLAPPSLETSQCEHKPVSLLIILVLIVLLYALTVGVGIYKIRQLSTKLAKVKREAETYSSVQHSGSSSIYENLNI